MFIIKKIIENLIIVASNYKLFKIEILKTRENEIKNVTFQIKTKPNGWMLKCWFLEQVYRFFILIFLKIFFHFFFFLWIESSFPLILFRFTNVCRVISRKRKYIHYLDGAHNISLSIRISTVQIYFFCLTNYIIQLYTHQRTCMICYTPSPLESKKI